MDQLKPLGFFATGRQISARETPLGLYKGLGAVFSGIIPKMAIRFASFERGFLALSVRGQMIELVGVIVYKGWMTGPDGKVSPSGTFVGESSCNKTRWKGG